MTEAGGRGRVGRVGRDWRGRETGGRVRVRSEGEKRPSGVALVN